MQNSASKLTESKEVIVGFNWIFKFLFIYIPLFIFITKDDTFPGANFITLLMIAIFLIAHMGFKSTSTGYFGCLNFYFFKICRKKFFRWDSYPYFRFDNSLGIVSISYGPFAFSQFYRFWTYNFDELAELLSHNTHFESYVRRDFIDYVNMRKQQSKIRKILPTIVFFIVLFAIIFGIKYVRGE
ncbi:MAG: hypothetical protein LBU89_01440 [Fibromonadaceae bacterium]|jgi:hypothetical protein|nr:hypothetical protein [Fibromonadaceae bacterium]